ncbi:hypothetical protein RCL1_006753 [Eukaryota sp. TZLM3-RCL]
MWATKVHICILILFFSSCFALELQPLPGLEFLANTLDDFDTNNNEINIDYRASGIKLVMKGRYSSAVVRVPQTTTLESLSKSLTEGSIFSFGGEVFRSKNCDFGTCQFERASPLSAFTSLTFTYETTRTKELSFSWNYDPATKGAKETFYLNQYISLPDTYFYAGSALTIDFAFNIFEGIKKCEARLVSEVDLSISVLLVLPNINIDTQIASISLGTYIIPLVINIPVSPRLVIDFVANAQSSGSFLATFRATNSLIKQTAGYASGFYFSNDFGTWETSFTQNSDINVQVEIGLRATIDINIARAMSVNVSITPTIDGFIDFGQCPGTAYLDLDFLIHRAFGISDIGFEVMGKSFRLPTATQRQIGSPSRHNLISRCLERQPFEVISSSVPQASTRSFWLSVSVTGSNLDKVYMVISGVRTEDCIRSSGVCRFAEAFSVREGHPFRFCMYRRYLSFFWETIGANIQRTIWDTNPITISSNGYTITLTPVEALEVEPNVPITIDWNRTSTTQGFYELVPRFKDTSVVADKILITSDWHSYDTRRVYAARNPGNSGNRIENLSVGSYSRMRLPSSRHHFVNVKCSPLPSNDLYLKVINHPTLGNEELAIKRADSSNWDIDWWYSWARSQSMELWRNINMWPDSRILSFTASTVSNTPDSRTASGCTVTSDSFYPSVYLSVSGRSYNTPFTFVYADVISCFSCCSEFLQDNFYYFDPFDNGYYSFFVQVTGQWSNLIQDNHISNRALFLNSASTLVSNADQTSCLEYYYFMTFEDHFSRFEGDNMVVLIEAPASTVTTLDCPQGLLWGSMPIDGDFWDLDEVLPKALSKSTIQINNQQDFSMNYVIVFTCEKVQCTGVIPSPRYSRKMISGVPFYTTFKGNTLFSSITMCLRGLITYDIDQIVNVLVDIPSSSLLFPVSGSGSFEVDHSSSEFRMWATFNATSFHWGTFTFLCINDASSVVTVPAHGTVALQLDTSLLLSGSSALRHGFAQLRYDDDSATLVGAVYSGKNSVLYLDERFTDQLIHVSSYGRQFVSMVDFYPYEQSFLHCVIEFDTAECHIDGLNQFTTDFADLGTLSTSISLVTESGGQQKGSLFAVELIDPRTASITFSEPLESGKLTISGSVTLTREVLTAQLTQSSNGGHHQLPMPEWWMVVLAVTIVVVVFSACCCRKKTSKPAKVVSVPLTGFTVAPVPQTTSRHVVFGHGGIMEVPVGMVEEFGRKSV